MKKKTSAMHKMLVVAGALATACALSFGLASCGAPSAEIAAIPQNAASYVADELIVGLDSAAASDSAGRTLDAIEEAGFGIEYMLSEGSDSTGAIALVAADSDLGTASASLARIPGISFVQPNYRYSAGSAAADADAAEQYYLADVDAGGAGVAAAWDAVDPNAKVGVAVLDTGAYTMGSADPLDFHQEFDGTNLNMELGRDFVHAEGGVPAPLVNASNPHGDDNGHGTHIAGIIAALSSVSSAGHTYGVAGTAPNAVVIPLKVLDASGDGTTAGFIMAYDYLMSIAGEANIHVANMSLSITDDEEYDEEVDGSEPIEGEDVTDDGLPDDPDPGVIESDSAAELEDKALEAKIEQAAAQGIVTVCAAGNESATGETFPGDMPACVCVEALDETGANAEFSNYNENKDISAPGVGIRSSWATQADAYRYFSGTSQATAVTSGVFAMLWAAVPGLTVDQAKAAVYNTAHAVTGETEHISPDADGIYSGSHGALDAAAAIAYAKGNLKSLADVANCKIEPIEEQEYTGKEITPAVKVTYGGKALAQGTDFTVTYLNNVEWGTETAVALVQGAGAYTGWVPVRFTIDATEDEGGETADDGDDGTLTTSISLSGANITLAKKSLVYTGKKLLPAVTVKIKVNGKTQTLKKGIDYTVTYKANKKPGKAKVIVKGKGKYTGTRNLTFKIKLGTTKVKKLKAGKRKLTVQWQRQKKGKVWYQVRYSTKKSMKGAKIRTVKKNATTKLTLKKLKSGKRYYVQVRTVKKLNGKWYKAKWSAKKAVKVK